MRLQLTSDKLGKSYYFSTSLRGDAHIIYIEIQQQQEGGMGTVPVQPVEDSAHCSTRSWIPCILII